MLKKSPWSKFEDWKQYGLINNYEKRNPLSLYGGENQDERSWYSRGEKKKWLVNFPFSRLKEQKPRGYYSKMSNEELIHFYQEHCKDMTRTEVAKNFPRLYDVMTIRDLRDAIPFSKKRKRNWFFRKMTDKEVLKYVISTYGRNVTKHDLKNKDSRLYDILCKRKLIDTFESRIHPMGFWKNCKNVEKELRRIIKENGGDFPSKDKLEEIGKSTVAFAISRYHGGFPAVRIKMGYDVKEKPKGYWKNLENVIKELSEAIKKNEGNFPTRSQLTQLGYRGLESAIFRYHNGLQAIQKRMGYYDNNRLENILDLYVNGSENGE